MKLLLTSNGLSNDSIARALFELVGKPAAETTIAFVPTAMNISGSDKGWFVRDLFNINKQGLKKFDIVDISALPQNEWLPRLTDADVLFFSGGNTPHLMRWMKESGLKDILPELLKTRVYAGISAGSIVTNPDLASSSDDKRQEYARRFGYSDTDGLGFVDFYLRPHFNAADKPHASESAVRELAGKLAGRFYAIDDESAIRVVHGNVDIVSEGKYLVLD